LINDEFHVPKSMPPTIQLDLFVVLLALQELVDVK